MSKIFAAALAVVAIGASPAPNGDEPDNIPYNAVIKLRCGGGSGTAFYISRDTLLTAEHVTAHAPCSINGKPVQILYENEGQDFAIVKGPPSRHVFRIRCEGYHPGQTAHAIGFADGKYRHTSRLQGERRIADDDRIAANRGLYMLTGQVFRGMSGGPVVDSSGTVVGLVNRGTMEWLPIPPQALSRELTETEACK